MVSLWLEVLHSCISTYTWIDLSINFFVGPHESLNDDVMGYNQKYIHQEPDEPGINVLKVGGPEKICMH